jgi:hypothetical protein
MSIVNIRTPVDPRAPIGAQAVSWQVEEPALMGLVDLNLEDGRNGADGAAALASIRPVHCLFGVPSGTQRVLNSHGPSTARSRPPRRASSSLRVARPWAPRPSR